MHSLWLIECHCWSPATRASCRTPERMFEYARTAHERGIQCIIAGALRCAALWLVGGWREQEG